MHGVYIFEVFARLFFWRKIVSFESSQTIVLEWDLKQGVSCPGVLKHFWSENPHLLETLL